MPLLNKLFSGKEAHKEVIFPPPLTLESLYEHQRVSIIGWIANKIGQLLGENSCHDGVLVYTSLHKAMGNYNTEVKGEYFLYIAEKLVSWIESGSDIYINVKDLGLPNNDHTVVLQVYELIKDDPRLYFNRVADKITEKTDDEKIWEVYRDVLHAATQRKFLLVKKDDVGSYIQGEILCDEPVAEKGDIPKARQSAKEALEPLNLPKSKIASYLLLISEAITNIIKHAKDGRLLIVKADHSLHILVQDKGNGFPLKILPYTTLEAGYSTKKSLGQGFTLMLKIANQVLLQTSTEGSTIILVFNDEKVENEES
jgi:anti-sigma regulatory factor (Ser/Thr protein kinase)